MRTAEWAQTLAANKALSPLFEDLHASCEWQSIAYEARPVLLAAAFHHQPRKIFVVTGTYEKALQWQAKLTLCGIDKEKICQMPSGSSALFEDASPEYVALSDRLGALRALVEDEPYVIISTVQAALERTLPREELQKAFVTLRPGDSIDVVTIAQQLINLGYEHQDPVRLPGQFSRRGGILDIYATGHDYPYRIELFGDDIESIRHFDPSSQRSVNPVSELVLVPSRETLFTGGEGQLKTLLLDAAEREASLLDPESAARLVELVKGDAEALGNRVFFDRLDLYRPFMHPDSGCAIDLLGAGDLLVLDEPLELEMIASRAGEELGQSLEARANRGEILRSTILDFMLPPEELASRDERLTLTAMNAVPEWLTATVKHDVSAMSMEPYRGRPESFSLTLKTWQEQDFQFVFTTDQPTRARSVLSQIEIFPEEGGEPLTLVAPPEGKTKGKPSKGKSGFHAESPSTAESQGRKGKVSKSKAGEPPSPTPSPFTPRTHPHPTPSTSPSAAQSSAQGEVGRTNHPVQGEGAHTALMCTGNIAGGFVLPNLKMAVVSDAELFGVARLRLPQKRFMEGAPVATVLDLKPGDYVVHIHFGIGIFRGLVTRDEHGIQKEFLFIEYHAPDKLFVPADQLDRIQKYLNPGDEHPKLNKLTGGEWQRTISKAKEDAQIFARELVELYAMRRAVKRRPYGPDTPWQQEMEATFPWVETPTQLRAIKEVKLDLNLDFPMDRLVCGDVGFGKTEVAIRAAFKTAQAGRQVAVLCPTTILSEQHFRNFEERLGPFGVRLELVNRFRTTAERHEVFGRLKTGDVDIVIGTHSLLGKEIQFKDLALVVIDEEQRFGVKQKEMLKKLRSEVDVLTLSATPIPRTLSMALMDIRQLSLITDPPPGRLPIRTFVRPYSAEVTREAILREVSRGGQVFYVYNRVESIQHVVEKLRRLVPTIRIGVGHGQMTEKELEPIMIGFIKGEIDVLLSTTIIESGLDISNANTLIVENSDRLGLAQLYQLRGRVGRSDRQAYAYLLYQSGKDLTENAMARLTALQEFSTLGSGYSLAFRDLQIRGAGEMLGAKQHGAMAAVGYELYTQLINEAVHMLKTRVDDDVPLTSDEIRDPLAALEPLPPLDAPVVALLPDSYVKDQAQRLYFYQKMMASRTEKELGEVQAEIEDRYGHSPHEVHNAFTVMSLRIRAKKQGIERMEVAGGRVSVVFTDPAKIPPRVFTILARKNRECYFSRATFVWPYRGESLPAVSHMLDSFDATYREIEEARASLGV
jgi:transcription-repair coupling factor